MEIHLVGGQGQLRFRYRDDAGTLNDTENSTSSKRIIAVDRKWHFVVVTKSGTTLTIYLDGTQEAQTTLTATNNFTNATVRTHIGDDFGDSSVDFVGLIDDVRTYTRALSAPEVLNLYSGLEPATANLVGYWKLDEGSGTTVIDSTGTQSNGTITSATYTTDPPLGITTRTTAGQRQVVRDFGTCLNFAGASTTDRVVFNDSNSLDLTSNMTITAWIYPKSMGASNAARIVNKHDAALVGYSFLTGANNTLRVRFDNVVYTSSSNNILTLNQWQHVAFTFNSAAGSNEIKFYVNGVAAGTSSRSSACSASTEVLTIGNNEAGVSNRAFDGRIDEIKVYNRTLTATEISNEYYGLNRSTSGLVLYTKFDEGSGTNATDSSGNQSAGAITGATYSTDVVMIPRTVVS